MKKQRSLNKSLFFILIFFSFGLKSFSQVVLPYYAYYGVDVYECSANTGSSDDITYTTNIAPGLINKDFSYASTHNEFDETFVLAKGDNSHIPYEDGTVVSGTTNDTYVFRIQKNINSTSDFIIHTLGEMIASDYSNNGYNFKAAITSQSNFIITDPRNVNWLLAFQIVENSSGKGALVLKSFHKNTASPTDYEDLKLDILLEMSDDIGNYYISNVVGVSKGGRLVVAIALSNGEIYLGMLAETSDAELVSDPECNSLTDYSPKCNYKTNEGEFFGSSSNFKLYFSDYTDSNRPSGWIKFSPNGLTFGSSQATKILALYTLSYDNLGELQEVNFIKWLGHSYMPFELTNEGYFFTTYLHSDVTEIFRCPLDKNANGGNCQHYFYKPCDSVSYTNKTNVSGYTMTLLPSSKGQESIYLNDCGEFRGNLLVYPDGIIPSKTYSLTGYHLNSRSTIKIKNLDSENFNFANNDNSQEPLPTNEFGEMDVLFYLPNYSASIYQPKEYTENDCGDIEITDDGKAVFYIQNGLDEMGYKYISGVQFYEDINQVSEIFPNSTPPYDNVIREVELGDIDTVFIKIPNAKCIVTPPMIIYDASFPIRNYDVQNVNCYPSIGANLELYIDSIVTLTDLQKANGDTPSSLYDIHFYEDELLQNRIVNTTNYYGGALTNSPDLKDSVYVVAYEKGKSDVVCVEGAVLTIPYSESLNNLDLGMYSIRSAIMGVSNSNTQVLNTTELDTIRVWELYDGVNPLDGFVSIEHLIDSLKNKLSIPSGNFVNFYDTYNSALNFSADSLILGSTYTNVNADSDYIYYNYSDTDVDPELTSCFKLDSIYYEILRLRPYAYGTTDLSTLTFQPLDSLFICEEDYLFNGSVSDGIQSTGVSLEAFLSDEASFSTTGVTLNTFNNTDSLVTSYYHDVNSAIDRVLADTIDRGVAYANVTPYLDSIYIRYEHPLDSSLFGLDTLYYKVKSLLVSDVAEVETCNISSFDLTYYESSLLPSVSDLTSYIFTYYPDKTYTNPIANATSYSSSYGVDSVYVTISYDGCLSSGFIPLNFRSISEDLDLGLYSIRTDILGVSNSNTQVLNTSEPDTIRVWELYDGVNPLDGFVSVEGLSDSLKAKLSIDNTSPYTIDFYNSSNGLIADGSTYTNLVADGDVIEYHYLDPDPQLGCLETGSFHYEVFRLRPYEYGTGNFSLGTFSSLDSLFICEEDYLFNGSVSDGIQSTGVSLEAFLGNDSSFDTIGVHLEAFNNTASLVVSYYRDGNSAVDRVLADTIDTTAPYANVTPYLDSIYIRYEHPLDSSLFGLDTLYYKITSLNISDVAEVETCNISSFDLTYYESSLLPSVSDLTSYIFTYYPDKTYTNPIANATSYSSSYGVDTVYVTISYDVCFSSGFIPLNFRSISEDLDLGLYSIRTDILGVSNSNTQVLNTSEPDTIRVWELYDGVNPLDGFVSVEGLSDSLKAKLSIDNTSPYTIDFYNSSNGLIADGSTYTNLVADGDVIEYHYLDPDPQLGCLETGSFHYEVFRLRPYEYGTGNFSLGTFSSLDSLFICEEDYLFNGSVSDGIQSTGVSLEAFLGNDSSFDTIGVHLEAFNNTASLVVSYYRDGNSAVDRVLADTIDTTAPYANVTPYLDSIYIRYEHPLDSSLFGLDTLYYKIKSLNVSDVAEVETCNISSFDLTYYESSLLPSVSDLTPYIFTYYPDKTYTNPIANATSYSSSYGVDTVYVTISNNGACLSSGFIPLNFRSISEDLDLGIYSIRVSNSNTQVLNTSEPDTIRVWELYDGFNPLDGFVSVEGLSDSLKAKLSIDSTSPYTIDFYNSSNGLIADGSTYTNLVADGDVIEYHYLDPDPQLGCLETGSFHYEVLRLRPYEYGTGNFSLGTFSSLDSLFICEEDYLFNGSVSDGIQSTGVSLEAFLGNDSSFDTVGVHLEAFNNTASLVVSYYRDVNSAVDRVLADTIDRGVAYANVTAYLDSIYIRYEHPLDSSLFGLDTLYYKVKSLLVSDVAEVETCNISSFDLTYYESSLLPSVSDLTSYIFTYYPDKTYTNPIANATSYSSSYGVDSVYVTISYDGCFSSGFIPLNLRSISEDLDLGIYSIRLDTIMGVSNSNTQVLNTSEPDTIRVWELYDGVNPLDGFVSVEGLSDSLKAKLSIDSTSPYTIDFYNSSNGLIADGSTYTNLVADGDVIEYHYLDPDPQLGCLETGSFHYEVLRLRPYEYGTGNFSLGTFSSLDSLFICEEDYLFNGSVSDGIQSTGVSLEAFLGNDSSFDTVGVHLEAFNNTASLVVSYYRDVNSAVDRVLADTIDRGVAYANVTAYLDSIYIRYEHPLDSSLFGLDTLYYKVKSLLVSDVAEVETCNISSFDLTYYKSSLLPSVSDLTSYIFTYYPDKTYTNPIANATSYSSSYGVDSVYVTISYDGCLSSGFIPLNLRSISEDLDLGIYSIRLDTIMGVSNSNTQVLNTSEPDTIRVWELYDGVNPLDGFVSVEGLSDSLKAKLSIDNTSPYTIDFYNSSNGLIADGSTYTNLVADGDVIEYHYLDPDPHLGCLETGSFHYEVLRLRPYEYGTGNFSLGTFSSLDSLFICEEDYLFNGSVSDGIQSTGVSLEAFLGNDSSFDTIGVHLEAFNNTASLVVSYYRDVNSAVDRVLADTIDRGVAYANVTPYLDSIYIRYEHPLDSSLFGLDTLYYKVSNAYFSYDSNFYYFNSISELLVGIDIDLNIFNPRHIDLSESTFDYTFNYYDNLGSLISMPYTLNSNPSELSVEVDDNNSVCLLSKQITVEVLPFYLSDQTVYLCIESLNSFPLTEDFSYLFEDAKNKLVTNENLDIGHYEFALYDNESSALLHGQDSLLYSEYSAYTINNSSTTIELYMSVKFTDDTPWANTSSSYNNIMTFKYLVESALNTVLDYEESLIELCYDSYDGVGQLLINPDLYRQSITTSTDPDLLYYYYEDIADAQNKSSNFIDENSYLLVGTLDASTGYYYDTLYLRVESATTACFDIGTIVFELDEFGIEVPREIESCDYADYDAGLAYFHLDELTNRLQATTTGTRNPYEIYYYDSESKALAHSSLAPTGYIDPSVPYLNTPGVVGELYVYIKDYLGCEKIYQIDLVFKGISDESTEEEDFGGTYYICYDGSDPSKYYPFLLVPQIELDNYSYYDYTWSTGAQTLSVDIYEPGVYTLTIVDKMNKCNLTGKYIVEPSVSPKISGVYIVPLDEEGVGSESITIISNDQGEFLYSIDGENYQASNKFKNVPAGIYTAYLKNSFGCDMIDSLETIISYSYPKRFTPNGDGINDEWCFMDESSGEASLLLSGTISIYTRQNILLHEMEIGECWDGKLNGVVLPQSDYWFKLGGAEVDGETTNSREIISNFSLRK